MDNVQKQLAELRKRIEMQKESEVNDDGRNKVSDKSLETLKRVMYDQDNYGMQKYNEPLHHKYNYNWSEMFLQEMADGMKYFQCEMERKEDVIRILEKAMLESDPTIKNILILSALGTLSAGGKENKEYK